MKSIFNWLDERYRLNSALEFAKRKMVPVSSHFVWYYFGGITLFLFGVQVFTGMLLLLYYKPGVDTAFESVQFIVTKVKFGWLLRSVHSWSANLMILSAFIHLFSNFFTASYRKPRELTWLTGMFMFLLAMAFGFSGYLLPWNELAYFATKVGTDIVGVLPIIGKPLMILLRGGEDVSGATLTRFYGIHIAILPALFAIILGLHLLFVQVQGMSEPSHLQGKVKKWMPFFPNFALRDIALWLLVLNVVALLAVFFPWELGVKADPFTPAPAGIQPEWYFLFMFQTLKLLPSQVLFLEGELLGIIGFTLAGAFLFIWPFLDSKSNRGEKQPLTLIIGTIAVLFIIGMTIYGHFAE
jgi:cytochrome b6